MFFPKNGLSSRDRNSILLFMKEVSPIITIEAGKRGGKPTIRGMRITVSDILNWLASGMTVQEILSDFEDFNKEKIDLNINIREKFSNYDKNI